MSRRPESAPPEVNDLIAAAHAAAAHYAMAAREAEDAGLKDLFIRARRTLEADVERLEAAVRQAGDLPKAPPEEPVEIASLVARLAAHLSHAPVVRLLDRADEKERAVADAASVAAPVAESATLRQAIAAMAEAATARRAGLDRLRGRHPQR